MQAIEGYSKLFYNDLKNENKHSPVFLIMKLYIDVKRDRFWDKLIYFT